MRWFLFVLSALSLLVGAVLWSLLRPFLTPFILAVVACGLGALACRLKPASRTILDKWILFLAVPVVAALVMLDMGLWPGEAEYRLDAVCDDLHMTVTATNAGPVELRPGGFRTAVAEGPALHLTADSFAVYADHDTNDQELARIPVSSTLNVRPLNPAAPNQPVFAAVTVDETPGPRILIGPSQGATSTGEVRLTWDRKLGAKQALIAAAPSQYQFSFIGQDYVLELHNCHVEFGTVYQRDLKPNETLKIHGQMVGGPGALVLSFTPNRNDPAKVNLNPAGSPFVPNGDERAEVDLNLGVQTNLMQIHVPVRLRGKFDEALIDRILKGSLNIEGGSSTSISAESAVEPRISVKGEAEIESCELEDDGLHVGIKGRATAISANKQDQLPNRLITFLHSPVVLAVLGFAVWFIDKLLNFVYNLYNLKNK